MLRSLFAGEGGSQAYAASWSDLVALVFGWILNAGQVAEGGVQINEMTTLTIERARHRDAFRPMSDQWRRDTAFILILLVLTPRRVARVCPFFRVAVIGTTIPWFVVVFDRGCLCSVEGTGTVVAEE